MVPPGFAASLPGRPQQPVTWLRPSNGGQAARAYPGTIPVCARSREGISAGTAAAFHHGGSLGTGGQRTRLRHYLYACIVCIMIASGSGVVKAKIGNTRTLSPECYQEGTGSLNWNCSLLKARSVGPRRATGTASTARLRSRANKPQRLRWSVVSMARKSRLHRRYSQVMPYVRISLALYISAVQGQRAFVGLPSHRSQAWRQWHTVG